MFHSLISLSIHASIMPPKKMSSKKKMTRVSPVTVATNAEAYMPRSVRLKSTDQVPTFMNVDNLVVKSFGDNCCLFWAMFLAMNDTERYYFSFCDVLDPCKAFKWFHIQFRGKMDWEENGYNEEDMLLYLQFLVTSNVIQSFEWKEFHHGRWQFPNCVILTPLNNKILVIFALASPSDLGKALTKKITDDCRAFLKSKKQVALNNKERSLSRKHVPRSIQNVDFMYAMKPSEKAEIEVKQSVIINSIYYYYVIAEKFPHKYGVIHHGVAIRYGVDDSIPLLCDNKNKGELVRLTVNSLGKSIYAPNTIREVKLNLYPVV